MKEKKQNMQAGIKEIHLKHQSICDQKWAKFNRQNHVKILV